VKVLALIVVSCAALTFGGCGGSGSTPDVTGGSTTQEQASTETGSQASVGDESKSSATAAGATKPPHVSVPSGPPPKQIVVKDLRKGTGAVLKPNTRFSARYVAVDYRTGKTLEDSWRDHSIFKWEFGPGSVVRAWAKGLDGMREGGRRELIAPSRLAYGKGAEIWVVDLLSVGESSG